LQKKSLIYEKNDNIDIPGSGFQPDGITYNPTDRNMYVIVRFPGEAYVIGSTTNKIVHNIDLGLYPPQGNALGGIAYNPANNYMYVTTAFNTVNTISQFPPTVSDVACPANYLQHWDMITFKITSLEVASSIGRPYNSELEVKIQDKFPERNTDIKAEVARLLGLNRAFINSIQILNVGYAIECALPGAPPPLQNVTATGSITNNITERLPSDNTTATTLR